MRPPSATRACTRSASPESSKRVGTPPRERAASADHARTFLASLGDDPLDQLFAAAEARRECRNWG